MSYCVAYGCYNVGTKAKCKGKSFFKFPLKNKEQLKAWLIQIKRANFKPSNHSVLCSDHFDEECFRYENFTNRRLLKRGAIPTKFEIKKEKQGIVLYPPNAVVDQSAENVQSLLEEPDEEMMEDISEWAGVNIEWLLEYEEFLIGLVHLERSLWDTRHPLYTNKSHRNCLIRRICNILISQWPEASSLFTYENVIKKLKHLITYFQRELKNLNKLKSEHGIEIEKPKWAHFERLMFLKDIGSPSSSSPNLIDDLMSEADNIESQSDEISSSFSVPTDAGVSVNGVECHIMWNVPTEKTEEIENAANSVIIPDKQCNGVVPKREPESDDSDDEAVAATAGDDPQVLDSDKRDDAEKMADMHFAKFIVWSLLSIKDPRRRHLCRMEIIQTLIKYQKESLE